MNSRIWYLLFTFPVALRAGQAEPDPQTILSRSLDHDRLNEHRARDYTYVQRVETRRVDGSGRVKSSESETFDVTMVGERHYSRKIAVNDKPLAEKEARKAQAAFDREFERRGKESESERRRRSEREEKRRAEQRAFRDEIPAAFDLTFAGSEILEGRPVWVIDAVPKRGYKGHAQRWELLTKFKGRLWIDQQEYQWVRVEAETIAPVSFGWVLAKLKPGARLTFRQARVNSEVWLPASATTRLDARLALLKRMNLEIEVAWRDYRKFRTDSKLVSAEELPPPAAKP